MKRFRRATGGALAAASAIVLLAGCSVDSGGTTPSPEETTLSSAAEEALDRAYAGVGSTLADLEPVSPPASEVFYSVSCGEAHPGCAQISAAMIEAADAAGWDARIADGKLSPEGFSNAIRQAVAGGATALSAVGISCSTAQAAFQEAADAGVTVVGGGAPDDCSPPLWASERLWLPGAGAKESFELSGNLWADYAWGRHNGDVRAVVLHFTTQSWGDWLTGGFEAQLASLGSGEVLQKIEISDPEIADGSFIQKVVTALLGQPEANTLMVPQDGWLTAGLAAAIVQAGLDEQLLVVSRGGEAPTLDLIREGGRGVDATEGFAAEWAAWGSVDTAIRIKAGQDAAFIGESIQLIDRDHNLPASGAYQGSVDFRALFRAAWGM